jgi:hypothetical protein
MQTEDRQRIERQAGAIARLRGAVFEYLVTLETPQDVAYQMCADDEDGNKPLVDELLNLIEAARTNQLRELADKVVEGS